MRLNKIYHKIFLIIIKLLFLFSFSKNSNALDNMTKIPNKNFKENAKNVLGTKLESCCFDPLTGYFRDGFCHTNFQDVGTHVVCAQITDEFLQFTLSRGNDLITPAPHYNFKGLKAGDFWCLCAMRWLEAHEAGVAPQIKLESTNSKTLDYIDLKTLKKYQTLPKK
jgi:uncharacterized protein (DUF2237 family)